MAEKTHIEKLLGFFALLALLLNGCLPRERGASQAAAGVIRVGLPGGAEEVTLSSKSMLTVRDADSPKVLSTAKDRRPVTIRATPDGMSIAGRPHRIRVVRVGSTSNEISVNGISYPGSLNIVRRESGLLVVNVVDLDTYLKAVVPCEMSPGDPSEALKAQAVVSRSFALSYALRNSRKDYDISSSAQVYNPHKRDERTDAAVHATRNSVLFYKGKILLPYFCASCGGFTEYASNVWETGDKFPPPVRCPFCREAPGYRWRARTTTVDLQSKLRSAGIADARSIAVRRRSTSGGRITALKIECSGGDKTIGINRFRMAMGPNVIRSGFFDIEVEEGYLIFTGRGWGHGIGMCQEGAKVLARRGKSFKSILEYYFPGARISKVRR